MNVSIEAVCIFNTWIVKEFILTENNMLIFNLITANTEVSAPIASIFFVERSSWFGSILDHK